MFDEVVSQERATEQHDAFTDVLRSHSVEVLYLEDLLAQTLQLKEARSRVLTQTMANLPLGPTLRPELEQWLGSLPAAELAGRLIGGVAFAELPFISHSLVALDGRPDAFAVPPLPNHLFTRDASSWAFAGVCVHIMATPARRREALHLEVIYRHHPLFAEAQFWSDGLDGDAALEGGDILVLGKGCLLVGMSERSAPAAVESYAARLFGAGAAERVIVLRLPGSRSTIHLDAVMTMVDRDAFTGLPGLLARLDAYVLTPSGVGVRARHTPDLREAIAQALGLPQIRVIDSGADARTAQREQWDEGHNVLAISPGVVVAYEQNRAINARLAELGAEVIPVPGSELARGRGGPRCMTCPIERAEP